MVEVANWALSVTVSTKKLAEVLNTSCYSCLSLFGFLKTNGLFPTAFHFSFEHRKEMWDEFLPPPPATLVLLSQTEETTSPYHPGAIQKLLLGGIQTLIKKRQFFFSTIGSNKLNKEIKLL